MHRHSYHGYRKVCREVFGRTALRTRKKFCCLEILTGMSQDSSGSLQQVPSTPLLTGFVSNDTQSRMVPDVGSRGSSCQSTPFLPLIFRIEGVPCTPYSVSSARTCLSTPNWTPKPVRGVPDVPSVKSSPDIQTVPSILSEENKNSNQVLPSTDVKTCDSPKQDDEFKEELEWFDNPSTNAQQVIMTPSNTEAAILRNAPTSLSQEKDYLNCLPNFHSVNVQPATNRPTWRSKLQADRINLLNSTLQPKLTVPDCFSYNGSIFA